MATCLPLAKVHDTEHCFQLLKYKTITLQYANGRTLENPKGKIKLYSLTSKLR